MPIDLPTARNTIEQLSEVFIEKRNLALLFNQFHQQRVAEGRVFLHGIDNEIAADAAFAAFCRAWQGNGTARLFLADVKTVASDLALLLADKHPGQQMVIFSLQNSLYQRFRKAPQERGAPGFARAYGFSLFILKEGEAAVNVTGQPGRGADYQYVWDAVNQDLLPCATEAEFDALMERGDNGGVAFGASTDLSSVNSPFTPTTPVVSEEGGIPVVRSSPVLTAGLWQSPPPPIVVVGNEANATSSTIHPETPVRVTQAFSQTEEDGQNATVVPSAPVPRKCCTML